jgi:hypothetical protein
LVRDAPRELADEGDERRVIGGKTQLRPEPEVADRAVGVRLQRVLLAVEADELRSRSSRRSVTASARGSARTPATGSRATTT